MYRSKAGFSMAFWGFTFPLGSLNLLTYALGDAFDSPFFKAFGSLLTGSVILLWIGCAGPTAYGWWRGSLFDAPCLSRLPRMVEMPDGKVMPKMDDDDDPTPDDEERRVDVGVGVGAGAGQEGGDGAKALHEGIRGSNGTDRRA